MRSISEMPSDDMAGDAKRRVPIPERKNTTLDNPEISFKILDRKGRNCYNKLLLNNSI